MYIRNNLIRTLRVIAFLVILVPGISFAQDKVIFALFTRGWAPFEFVADGNPYGAAVELHKALMPDGVEAVVDMMPAPRSVLRIPGNPIYTRIECRKWVDDPSKYLWSDTVLTVNNVLYSPASKPVSYAGEESLYGLTIGCIKNYFYPEVQSLFDSGKATRYDVNGDILLLRMLKEGRVDAAVFDDVTAAWLIHQASDLTLEDYHVAEKSLGRADLQFVFNKNTEWQKRLPELNRKIQAKREDGTIDEIMSRYR